QADETVEKSRMGNRRWIPAANRVKNKVQRRNNQHAPNPRNPKHDLRKSHGAPIVLQVEWTNRSQAGLTKKGVLNCRSVAAGQASAGAHNDFPAKRSERERPMSRGRHKKSGACGIARAERCECA